MRAFLVALLFIPVLALSQTQAELINDLKNGVVLVRLMTREKSIQALKDAGRHDQAQAVAEQQKEENQEIVKSFQDNFDYCQVMFFYSGCSHQVRERQFEGCLRGYDLELLSWEQVSDVDKFFVAEFGHVEPSDQQNFSHYSFEYTEEGDKEMRKNYYGDTDIGVDALVLRNDEFRQLGDPFPYFVRTYRGLPWKRSKAKTVAKMNKNLHAYLRKPHK